ncbi:hypothetical protein MRX96_023762 [Rhipicephalus microplus]
MTPANDFHACCVDEIALEGLDGITLQALWVRLQMRPNFPLSLDSKSKAFMWRSLLPDTRLSFYVLGKPRIDLVVYDRYKNVDANTGYVVEPKNLPPDPYPFKMINKNGLMGSCSTFETRANVTDEIRRSSPTLDDVVSRWDKRLSASAASRYLGQTTQGQLDMRVFKLTHATMFILRKQLVQRNLITKQEFCLKVEGSNNRFGFLLHLPRFYVEVKTKTQIMAREMCALLASKPNRREVTSKLLAELGLTTVSAKKIFHGAASKYVTRRTVPYGEYYPDSSREERYNKNNKQRIVRFCELVKPFVEEAEEEEEDPEDDSTNKSVGLFFHPQRYVYDRTRLNQAHKRIYMAGLAGTTMRELSIDMMTTRLEARNILKALRRRQLIVPYREDMGKQRVLRYFCPEFAKKSEVHKKLAAEKKRMLEQPRVEPVPAKKRKSGTPPSRSGGDCRSDSLPGSSTGSLPCEQPTVTVETNSECFFRKMLARANRIIEYVQVEKVLSDFTKLLRALQKIEEEEGSTMKLDKDIKLICMPSITKDDEIVKAHIEQAKFKFFQSAPKEPKKQEAKAVTEPSPCSKMTYNPAMGRFYGVQPKFRRMHLCYAFMHYLLYSYEGAAQDRSSEDPSIPTQYHHEIGWKMFVPPLSKSPSTPEGWVLFADVLLSLPLSIFVKIASSIRHKIEGLEEYLDDKVKCHYLVRNLPVKLRNALLFARRYIYSIP